MSAVFKIPSCKHGVKATECQACKEEFDARVARELKAEEDAKWKLAFARKANPETWLRAYKVRLTFLGCSFENYEGGETIKAACREFPGKSILLHGPTGCGKTHLAVATLRELIQKNALQAPGAIMITFPELLMHIRGAFDSKGSGESEITLVNRFTEIPVLILDDLGSEKTSEWAISTLYLILDKRNGEGMPTFITSNIDLKGIGELYGTRIASRLSDMKICGINRPDYRKKRATA